MIKSYLVMALSIAHKRRVRTLHFLPEDEGRGAADPCEVQEGTILVLVGRMEVSGRDVQVPIFYSTSIRSTMLKLSFLYEVQSRIEVINP